MGRPSERRRASAAGAGPSQLAESVVGVLPQYTKTEAPASVTKLSLNWQTQRSTAARRLAELVRLFQGRRHCGLIVDPHLSAWTLAATLGSVAAGPYKVSGRQRFLRWHGLDLEALQHAIKRAELGNFSGDELRTIIRDIERGHIAHGARLIRPAKLGDLLQVTAAEREAFRLRTIDACDESREARKARQAEANKVRDAERKRAKRGRTPWPIYKAQSLTAQRPWEAEGISRRTWERHRKRDANVSEHVLSQQDGRTRLRQGLSLPSEQAVGDPSSTDRPSRNVGGRATGGMEDQTPSPKKMSEAIGSYVSGSSSTGPRSLDASRMFQKGLPTMKFDPSAAIASLIEVEAVLCELAAKTQGAEGERFEKLAGSVGIFRLLLEVSAESQPDDSDDILAMGVGHLVPRLRAANDNRLMVLAQRLAA